EQALGRTNLEAHTDIYSVGALAYFLLTGRPPFVRDTPMQLLVAHVHEKPTPLGEVRPEVPEDLQAWGMKCLEEELATRYPTAEDVEQALAQCASADLWTRQAAARWWRESDTAPSSAVTALAG